MPMSDFAGHLCAGIIDFVMFAVLAYCISSAIKGERKR